MLRPLSLLLPALAVGASLQSPQNGRRAVETRAASNITTLPAQFFPTHGSKRVELQYGPYTVPPRTVQNGMKDFEEMSVQMPCTDCLITWMQADLHYMNGTEANANNGLWLHHTVLINTHEQGPAGEKTPSCPNQGDWFFASGNERTPVDICVNGTDEVGYYVAPGDGFASITELMNMGDEAAQAMVNIKYEYIPSPPSSFAHAKALWLDIGACKGSDMPAFANKTFHYTSPEWTAPTDGRVTWIVSHLHDGGTSLDIQSNGQTVCDAIPTYGGNPAYIEYMEMNMTMNGMPMEMDMPMSHISAMTQCANTGIIKTGDKWSVTANYNTSEYSPMLNTDGSLDPIMGIAIVYYVEGTSVKAANGSTIVTAPSQASQSSSQASSTSMSTSTSKSAGLRLGVSGTSSIALAGFVGFALLL